MAEKTRVSTWWALTGCT